MIQSSKRSVIALALVTVCVIVTVYRNYLSCTCTSTTTVASQHSVTTSTLSPSRAGVRYGKEKAENKQVVLQTSSVKGDVPHQQLQAATSRALKNIDKCMYASNLTSPALLAQSRQNAQLFMEQHGSVVSQDYLPGYINHCWNISYSLTQSKLPNSNIRLQGNIGQLFFDREYPKPHFFEKYVETNYNGSYNSSAVCLPNVYQLGFEKCGSSFFWCMLMRILNNKGGIMAGKEPYFWTDFRYTIEKPHPTNLATRYISMYLKGSDKNIPVEERKEMAFIDACPSTVIEWPKFTETEQELTNYCLLPSALPELFPTSKYLVIMRNPVKMMYSSFWWSFVIFGLSKQENFTNGGPESFDAETRQKITIFLNCINDHPSVKSQAKCTLNAQNYAECIINRAHLLTECVTNITTKRKPRESVIHRGIYYVHVRKWLKTVPRERIFFTTLERLTGDTQSVVREAYKMLRGSELNVTDTAIDLMKKTCWTNENKVAYKTPSLEMLESTKTMLEKFFEPFNKLLSELLEDEQFLWLR